jgi:acyl-CoA synthetase (AMP-forming)/AMP-acid ligase II
LRHPEILAQDEALLGCAAADIVSRLPSRLSHGILSWIERTPDAFAVRGKTGTLTYRELGAAVEEAKTFLTKNGVRPGDRVMLVSENSVVLMCLVLALSEMDGVAAIINARLSDREIDLIESDCDPRLVVYTTEDSADAATHAEKKVTTPHSLSVGKVETGEVRSSEPEPVGQFFNDTATTEIYTTGTTGTPKGVMLTHRNLSFIAFVSGRLRGITPGDPVYVVLPMSHVFGLSAVSCSVLFSGGRIDLVARFDAREALRALREDDIVGFLGVPTMYALMLEALESMPDWQAPRLRFMFSGGAPLDPDIKQRVQEKFGLPLHNGYGLTESGPTICQTRLYAPLENCSVGFVLPGEDVRVLDTEGKALDDGEVGELWVKGPNIMKGYFRKPELTSDVLKDGWLNTGDLVFIDETGSINIAGRTKELIIRSGFNVYPPEVESVLTIHPDISLAAVVGRDVGSDEQIVAFIQPVAGRQIDTDELKTFIHERLAGYKVPQEFVVMAELPTAPSGKILKHKLKTSG